MNPKSNSELGDEIRDHYDFSGGVRGKFYDEYQKGTNVILLDPDVAEVFHDAETVNQALRKLISQNESQPQAKQS